MIKHINVVAMIITWTIIHEVRGNLDNSRERVILDRWKFGSPRNVSLGVIKRKSNKVPHGGVPIRFDQT